MRRATSMRALLAAVSRTLSSKHVVCDTSDLLYMYVLLQVAEMKTKLRALDSQRMAQLTRQADRMATEFEAQRELDEVCLVVDMVRQSVCLFWNVVKSWGSRVFTPVVVRMITSGGVRFFAVLKAAFLFSSARG